MSEPSATPPSNEPTPTPPVEPTPEATPTPTPTEPTPPTEPENKEPAPEFVPLTADDIQFPEGFEVQEGLRDEFLGIVNNRELDDKGRTSALIGLYAKAQTAASEANSQAWADMQDKWQGEVKADPTVGGVNFDATMTKVGKLMEEFGNDNLRQVFDMTGAGNNVHVISFLSKLSDKLTEGAHVLGNPASTPASAASKLFPSMKN